MKFVYIIIILSFFHSYICVAQTHSDKDTNKVERVKIAYMAKELNLTPEESLQFWPIYNNYFLEIKQARKSYLNDEVAFEEHVVQIRKKYKGDFKRILNGDARVNRIFVSEKNLRDLLKKELQSRQKFKRPPTRKPFPGKQRN